MHIITHKFAITAYTREHFSKEKNKSSKANANVHK